MIMVSGATDRENESEEHEMKGITVTRELRAEWERECGKGKREYFISDEPNSKGETIEVELGTAYPLKEWKKRLPEQYVSVTVYATDETGCWGKYNPQITADHKINFFYILEDTEENRQSILCDIFNLAFEG